MSLLCNTFYRTFKCYNCIANSGDSIAKCRHWHRNPTNPDKDILACRLMGDAGVNCLAYSVVNEFAICNDYKINHVMTVL